MRRIHIVLALLALALVLAPAMQAEVPGSSALAAIDRPLDPVIVTGQAMPALNGVPLNQLFVYAYQAGAWHQIPWQFDEVANGHVVATGNGVLDPQDELVIMGADLGERAPLPAWISDATARLNRRQEITVTDPLDPSRKGWVYVYRSTTLTNSITSKYANFNSTTFVGSSDHYQVGVQKGAGWANQLKLNNSTVNLADRTKLRLYDPVWGLITENAMTYNNAPIYVKNGAVRATLTINDEGRDVAFLHFYHGCFDYTLDYDLKEFDLAADWGRVSLDLSPAASGSTYYDRNTPAGVTIDGNPDNVAKTPASNWFQISAPSGTFIEALDWSAAVTATTVISTYYKDDSRLDSQWDTGDLRSYGDAGIYLAHPGARFKATVYNYVLPAGQANVGAHYRDTAMTPLQATVTSQALRFLRLPLALKGH